MNRAVRILVASRNASAMAELCAALDRAGLRTVTASSAAAAEVAAKDLGVEAVLLDLGDGREDESLRLAAAFRRNETARPLIAALLPEGHGAASPLFDLAIRRPCHAGQVCARLQEALRQGVREAEARLRRRTLGELGVAVPPPHAADAGRVSVLFVGAADPAFMHLRSALSEADIDVVAAFTSFTAFDYLHDRLFHAVVLNALKSDEPAFTICSAMRRNAALFHAPAVLLVDPARFDKAEEAFARGASDILSQDAPPQETRDRILALAGERMRGLALRAEFDQVRDPAVLDRTTGVFNRDVFAVHLRRMADWAAQGGKPLSLAVLRVQPSLFSPVPASGRALDMAQRQFGTMLRHLTRTEDFPTRLDAGIYAVSMPATGLEEALAAAERIRASAECAAFGGGEQDGGVRISLSIACAELAPEESAARFLKRAVEGLAFTRPRAPLQSEAS